MPVLPVADRKFQALLTAHFTLRCRGMDITLMGPSTFDPGIIVNFIHANELGSILPRGTIHYPDWIALTTSRTQHVHPSDHQKVWPFRNPVLQISLLKHPIVCLTALGLHGILGSLAICRPQTGRCPEVIPFSPSIQQNTRLNWAGRYIPGLLQDNYRGCTSGKREGFRAC
jgi:hypothetical protein